MDKPLTFRSRLEGRTIPRRGGLSLERTPDYYCWPSICKRWTKPHRDVTWRWSRWASKQRAARRWTDVNKESLSLRPARKLPPLFPSLPVDDFFVFSPFLSISSFSRVALPYCVAPDAGSRVRARSPAESVVPAGWSVSLSVRLRRCAAAHGGVMATLSWLWGSPRARSHPHAMWKGDQYPTPAIPAFPPRVDVPLSPFDSVLLRLYWCRW